MSTMRSEETSAASLIDAWLSQGVKWTGEKQGIHDRIVQLLRSRGQIRHSGFIYRLTGGSFSREPERRRQAPRKGPEPAIGSVVAGKVAGRRKRAR